MSNPGRPSAKDLAERLKGEAASHRAISAAQAALQAGARGDESAAERASRIAAQQAQEERDAKLALLTSSLLEARLDSEGSSADMSDAEFATYLQEQLNAQDRQEAADEELARKFADAERSGNTGALAAARVKKLSTTQSQGAGRGVSGRNTPTSDAEC